MSGKKEGFVGGGDAGADIPVTLALLPLTVGVGVLSSGVMIGRGMVRLTQAAYDSLYNMANNAVLKELERIDQKISQALKVSELADISNLYKTPSYEALKDSLLITEKRKIEDIESLISFFSEEKKVREDYEIKKGLRDDMSWHIEKEIDEYKRRKEKEEKTLKEKEKRLQELKKVEGDQKKKNLLGLLNHIYTLCNIVEEFYPEQAEKAKKELENVRLEKRSITMLVKKHGIEEKFRHIQNNSVRENLKELAAIRYRYMTSIHDLENSRKEEFKRALNSRIIKAENNQLTREDIKKLEEILQKHLKEEQQKDKYNRFEVAQEKIRRALINKGYKAFKSKRSERYWIIEGTKEDGKKASLSILLPHIEDEKLPHIKTEVNPEGYEAIEEWNREGEEIAKEIESLGVVIDFEEAMTHFKGRLVENAIRMLGKGLKSQLSDKDFEINLVNDTHVTINGMKLYWGMGTGLNDMIALYNKSMEKTVRTPERERLKEGI